MSNVLEPKTDRDYIAISDHGLIGNLRTAAMVSLDGSIESYCVPNFDSPSIFARILDKNKGGHFSITPIVPFTTKQNYLPSSNVLQTKFLNEKGVVSVTDFLPRPLSGTNDPLLPWLIRRVEVIRGEVPLRMECAPAFNYARDKHELNIEEDTSAPNHRPRQRATFHSKDFALDLRYAVESTVDNVAAPSVDLSPLDLSAKGHLGLAVTCDLNLTEGQCVAFVLRTPPSTTGNPYGAGAVVGQHAGGGIVSSQVEVTTLVGFKTRAVEDPLLTADLVLSLLNTTVKYWQAWIRRSTYQGSWKESVHRSALALKLLIFEPTGAVVASPTFSLPEYIGGTRNWDYRASWIRDSSFTLYALIRLGYTYEANSYMDFIFERLRNKNPDGSLQIMYTIHGGKELEEIELTHLDGHKGSKPVRIGNGAADHVQLDIYGELMDCIYLGQKFGKPLSYDDWVLVRELVDFVVEHYQHPDLSIWEVRNKKRHFTYSKHHGVDHALVRVDRSFPHILGVNKYYPRVAIDRGLRLADKRSLPCPNRNQWLTARDTIYEDIMHKAWNNEGKYFGQSYEDKDVLDSAVLIMPLVFFMQASDPRFVNTLKQILKTPERGGLTSNNLVYRYDVSKSDDGVGGEEGTFCLCTLWCVEALTRAGEYDKSMLPRAVAMFEEFLLYLNHLALCTEEISEAGEGLGNAVQGFTYVSSQYLSCGVAESIRKARYPYIGSL
ncbi:glycoside hydrolase family 15 protein [Pleurotus eryngii]|uniref:Glycoside hydrolase family 15 protein n=1 Tax=Pleurotus eryngii TaxID=5323 RepID=A0A9P5ZSJ9_PLEER|nr:glycoside hydrolase family 15 protein [Pleurotus eryngii]